MKIRHRVPIGRLTSDITPPEYEAEVAVIRTRAEAAYHKAERRLAKQQAKLDRARQQRSSVRRDRLVAEQEALVELRRLELLKYHRLMVAVPASTQHRGRGSHRHVPSPEVF